MKHNRTKTQIIRVAKTLANDPCAICDFQQVDVRRNVSGRLQGSMINTAPSNVISECVKYFVYGSDWYSTAW